MPQNDVTLSVGFNIGSIKEGAFTQPLGRITAKASEFQKSLEASNARVIAFGASAGAIYALRVAFQKLVTTTIEVEKSLIEINTLLNLSSTGLKSFSSGLFQVASQTSQSFQNAAKAAQEFARQGLSAEETLKRTKDALILNKLSGLDLESAVSSLTATMNSFGKEALTTAQIVDKLSNVDAQFAVSAADLAEALKRVGSSASDANVHFNEMIALVTSAQQITARGGSVIGNSFKTIFTRLQRPQVLDDLEAVGVSVRTTAGKTRPLIEVLRNLSSTYDTLSESQRSFITEAVGGVFQINTLKATLSDLGNGFSIYDGAVRAAERSTFSAQRRIEELNKTVSSQLTRVSTEWTRALANIDSTTPAIRGGMGFFGNAGKLLGDLTDSSKDSALGSATQGIFKGLGTAIAGPGVQFAIFTLLKLLQKLASFAAEAFQDFSKINKTERDRIEAQENIATLLGKQKALLNDVLTGEKTLQQAHDIILKKMVEESNQLRLQGQMAKELAVMYSKNGNIQRFVTPTKGKAEGYIPNLSVGQEIAGARAGGYHAGAVVPTSVSSGGTRKDVIANTAETMSSIKFGNKLYQWINPPKNSIAGMAHASRSMASTGINPYELGQSPVCAAGFVPNLADLSYDRLMNVLALHASGDDLEILKQRFARSSALNPGTRSFDSSKVKQAIFRTLETAPISSNLKGNRDVISSVQNAFLGGSSDVKMKASDIREEDIRKMLSLRGGDFGMFAALADYNNRSILPRGPHLGMGSVDHNGKKYGVNFNTATLSNPDEFLGKYNRGVAAMKQEMGLSPTDTPSGQSFGDWFGLYMGNQARNMGLRVAGGRNDTLDLLSYNREFGQKFFGSSQMFAGGDFKSSLSQDNIDSMSAKVFRTLTGQGSEAPAFSKVGKFKGGLSTGLLDYDMFGGGSRKSYESLVYAAVASGKPLRVNVGATGSGKTHSGLGLGGKTVKSFDELGSYGQFVLNSASQNPLSGISGLAMASASDIVGFNLSKEQIRENIRRRIANLPAGDYRSKDTFISQQAISDSDLDFSSVFELLKGKFGSRFSFAAGGMIPSVKDALLRENRATGGNAKLSNHSSLITADNPLGLAAIDARSQGDAAEAIRQHKMLGQSLPSIRRAKTASGGHIPNLAIDSETMFSTSFMLGMLQFGKGMDSLNEKTSRLQKVFSVLASSTDRNVMADKDFIHSIEEAKNQLIVGKTGVITHGGKTTQVGSIEELNEKFGKTVADATENIKKSNERKSRERERFTRIGGSMAFGSSIVGGVLSEAVKPQSADAAKAIDTFAKGATIAGQIMMTFPTSRVARGAAMGVAGGSVLESIKDFNEKLASQQAAYGKQQEKVQKLNSSLDSVAQSLSNLDNMALDSSVNLDALNREYRKFSESMANFAASGATREQIARVTNAPDSKSKISAILGPGGIKESINQQLENQAVGLALSEQISKQSGMIGGFGKGGTRLGLGISGGVFGFSGDTEKAANEQLSLGMSSNLISRLNDEQKEKLERTFQTEQGRNNFSLGTMRGLGNQDVNSFLDKMQANGSADDLKLITNQLKFLVGQSSLDKNPAVIAARAGAMQANENAQFPVEMLNRKEQSLRRSLINGTAVNVENRHAVKRNRTAQTFGEYDLGLFQNEGQARLNSMFYGEETNQNFELKNQQDKVNVERARKLADLKNNSSKGVTDLFTQNLDSFIQASDTGAKNPLNAPVFNVSSQKQALLNSLNTGISKTVDTQDISSFRRTDGQFDFEKFKGLVLSNSGQQGTTVGKTLEKFLQSNEGSLELAKIAQTHDEEALNIEREHLLETRKNGIAQENIKKLMEAQRDAGFLGGSKLLTDRGFRRQTQRDLIRSGAMLESKNSEVKAMGAVKYLETIKNLGIDPLKISKFDSTSGKFTGIKGDKLSENIAKALNIGAGGLNTVQSQMLGGVSKTLGKQFGGDSLSASLLTGGQAYFKRRGLGIAGTAIANTIKPEGAEIINGTTNAIAQDFTTFTAGMNKAETSLNSFGIALENIARQITETQGAKVVAQQFAKRVQEAGVGQVKAVIGANSRGIPGTPGELGAGSQRGAIQNGLQWGNSGIVSGALSGIGSAILYNKFFGKGGMSAVQAAASGSASAASNVGSMIMTNSKGGKFAVNTAKFTTSMPESWQAANAARAGTSAAGMAGNASNLLNVASGSGKTLLSIPKMGLGGALGVAGAGLAGYEAGTAINNWATNKWISPYERQAAQGESNYQQMLASSPALSQIQELRHKINQYKSFDFNRAGSSSEQKSEAKDRRDKAVEEMTKQLENLYKNGLKINQEAAQAQGGQLSLGNLPISIEISLKDADKIPDALAEKLIKPLEQQLLAIQSQIANIQGRVGITPNPPKV